ncbi:hybrid sensor histidine kinase/response regulator [bacterium]|nr:hybrid sensor histidine kinase/response regulator [bacterium]
MQENNGNNTDELMHIFQVEAEDIIERIFDDLEKLLKNPANKEITMNLYREMHSLKGALRMVGYSNIQMVIHKCEDIFDIVNSGKLKLTATEIKIIIKSVELVSSLIQESLDANQEILREDFNSTVSVLENIYTLSVDDSASSDMNPLFQLPEFAGLIPEGNNLQDLDSLIDNINSISVLNEEQEENNVQITFSLEEQEMLNEKFNKCFELVDSLVPEEESQDTVILIEELNIIYDKLKEFDIYEVKTSLQNIITKLDFVSKATNIFTVSEILEIRNELSSAAAKFNTFCVDETSSDTTFFDIAEKILMLQSSCVYAQEIKTDLDEIKKNISSESILEIIATFDEILNFILENSVQLEEQMAQTLKSAVEYCASPHEGIDGDLIIQQLEIMKQLLELNFKKDSGISEIKNLSAQSSIVSKSSTEIKTLHVNAHKLDLLVNLLGELIITKIKAEKKLEKIDTIKNSNENCQKDLLKTSNYLRYYNKKYLQSNLSEQQQYTPIFVKQIFSLLSDITHNISKTIYDLDSLYRTSKEDDMKVRMIIDEMESMIKNIRVLPISTVFNSFSRMVRDIASEKNKDIDFEIQGNDTCADKKIIEEIKTPLIHILRNAIDHGIESKEERILAGKNPVGKILLSAKQDDNKVMIDVIDDGQGFNLDKIKDRAISRGFLTQEDINSMTDEAIMNIIFWPGFTTGDSITSISGRGIGLDVVKTKISQLNGKVKVISEFGKGSCVHIEIPVTLATLRVFLVQISNQTFAIPIQVITTFVTKRQDEIKTNNGNMTIIYNNRILPLYYLSNILGLEQAQRNDRETILIIESDDISIGLVVDKLLGDQDVLLKKLPAPLYKVQNISGVTNLASGELCLILNIQDIVHYDFNKAIASQTPIRMLSKDINSYKNILVVDDSITTRTMVKNILSNNGYNVEVAIEPNDAFAKLKLAHFDLIVTDIQMPNIDGVEFIKMLKGDEIYADIPIIVISSIPKEKLIKDIPNDYVEKYIKKDEFDQEIFINVVANILGKYHER